MSDAQTPVLTPCPFCGIPARPVRHSAGMRGTIGYDQWHGVSCIGCNACVGATDRRFRTVEEAAAAWNQRAAQAPAQPGPTMDDALAAGDGPLHGAVDHWQEQALAGRAVMQQALDAIDAEFSDAWECNAYHPKLYAARAALFAALSATMEKPNG